MLNKLVCPDCKTVLSNKERLYCPNCHRKFKIIGGVPLLLPKKLSILKVNEKKFYSTEFKNPINIAFGELQKRFRDDWWGLSRQFEILKNINKQNMILEIGAGNGQYGLFLKKEGFQNVIISDLSPFGMMAARKYANKMKMPYRNSFYSIDAENLPFKDNCFDIIFIVAALHHFENIPKAIDEINRCLKNNGLVIIAVEPNRWYFKVVRPLARLFRIRRIQSGNKNSSFADEKTTGFTFKELENYLNGFKILQKQRIWYLTGILYYTPDLIKRLTGINISISKKARFISLKIDRFIELIPILNRFSFHITIIGQKNAA